MLKVGRLLRDANAKVVVTEATRGDPATLICDGSEASAVLSFEALDLITDFGYAFKVAPVNSIGDEWHVHWRIKLKRSHHS